MEGPQRQFDAGDNVALSDYEVLPVVAQRDEPGVVLGDGVVGVVDYDVWVGRGHALQRDPVLADLRGLLFGGRLRRHYVCFELVAVWGGH